MAEGAEGKRSERDGRGCRGLGAWGGRSAQDRRSRLRVREQERGGQARRHRKGNTCGIKTWGGGVNLT